jgi:hypothetical protein
MTGTAPAIPEFELGAGTRQSGNTVSLFADNIFLIGAGNNNDIYQTLYPMASGLAAPMLSNKSLWGPSGSGDRVSRRRCAPRPARPTNAGCIDGEPSYRGVRANVKFALTRLPHLVALRDIVDSDGQA